MRTLQWGKDLEMEGWLIDYAHSINTLIKILRLKPHCLELSKSIFAVFFFLIKK